MAKTYENILRGSGSPKSELIIMKNLGLVEDFRYECQKVYNSYYHRYDETDCHFVTVGQKITNDEFVAVFTLLEDSRSFSYQKAAGNKDYTDWTVEQMFEAAKPSLPKCLNLKDFGEILKNCVNKGIADCDSWNNGMLEYITSGGRLD